jgi:hypothetical protein
MPLRQLISSLPSALTKLAPCLLMSPLSVAQHLSAATALFDVVIFDEASQIRVWDAVGAMARGRQNVIVGEGPLPNCVCPDRANSTGPCAVRPGCRHQGGFDPPLSEGLRTAAHVKRPPIALGVEPQQVVLGQPEAADRYLALQATMRSVPVVAMEPDR